MVQKRIVDNCIAWEMLEREKFERAVNSLLLRVHAGAAQCFAPNDSGGDGGVDFLVEYDSAEAAIQANYPPRRNGERCRIIYQYKYFPDGLVDSAKGRMRQVMSSLVAAAKREPDYWVLVIPGLIKEKVRENIAMKGTTLGVVVKFLDQTDLDDAFIKQPDLLAHYAERDDYLDRRVALYNAEKAVVYSVSDLVERVQETHTVGEDLDPDWRAEVSIVGGKPTVGFVAKHPRALEVSPLVLRPRFKVGAFDERVRRDFERVIEYGASGTVDIPGHCVDLSDYTAPAIMKLPDKIERMQISASEGSPHAVGSAYRLLITDREGRVLLDDEGTVKYGNSGVGGFAISASMTGGVEIEMLLPFDTGEDVTVNTSIRSAGRGPRDVKTAVENLRALNQGARIEVYLNGKKAAVMGGKGDQSYAEVASDYDALWAAADDLEALQRYTRRTFPMPEVIEPMERLWLRTVRLALEGKVAPTPLTHQTIHLNPEAREQGGSEQGFVLIAQFDVGKDFPLKGRDLPLPRMLLAHPHVTRADDPERRMTTLTPAEGEVFVMWAEGVLEDHSGHVTPWEIPGGPEPKVPTLRFAEAKAETPPEV